MVYYKTSDGRSTVLNESHVLMTFDTEEEFSNHFLGYVKKSKNEQLYSAYVDKIRLFLDRYKNGMKIHSFSTYESKSDGVAIDGFIIVDGERIINYMPSISFIW